MASLIERAWAAGFFDGEGTVFCQTWEPKPEHKQPNGHASVRVALKQVEYAPIARFAAAVGQGRVRGPYARRRHAHNARPCHEWAVSGKKAEAVLEMLMPLLSEPKREQAIAALAAVAAWRLEHPQVKERV